jgi:hypothetical protein
LGQAGCEELLQLTIEAGVAEKIIEERDMAEVLVDTTVMEKAITIHAIQKQHVEMDIQIECRTEPLNGGDGARY